MSQVMTKSCVEGREERPVGQPVKPSMERPVEQSEDRSAEHLVERSIANHVEHPAERSTEHSASQSSETYCGGLPERSSPDSAKYAFPFNS